MLAEIFPWLLWLVAVLLLGGAVETHQPLMTIGGVAIFAALLANKNWRD